MVSDQFISQLGQGGTSFTTFPGTVSTFDPTSLSTQATSVAGASITTGSLVDGSDTRIRLRAMNGNDNKTQVYGPENDSTNIQTILWETNGLLFPFSPTITVTQSVDYSDVGTLVHSNSDFLAYRHTPSVTITVAGDFSVQNQREGVYALAVLQFLRTCSKMYFGDADKISGKAGLPPPILIFTGYGNYVFNNLPVILKSHSYTFDKAMNMILITTAQGSAKLPALFNISMELQVQQTPHAMRTVFSLDAFRTGKLMSATADTGWI